MEAIVCLCCRLHFVHFGFSLKVIRQFWKIGALYGLYSDTNHSVTVKGLRSFDLSSLIVEVHFDSPKQRSEIDSFISSL
jgi:hypothetical protein